MRSPDDPNRTTFGKRRTLVAAPDPQAGSQAGAQAGSTSARAARAKPIGAAGPLPWALRVAGLVGIVAVIGAYQLARMSRPDVAIPGAALATAALPPTAEPETTGAIAAARSARTTRLDPCFAPATDRLRP
ncbi:hypothetical protein R1A27_27400 [Methylobacterium sp. NMS12]|uniref:hypothetical protein n=1 Tax=Methylobacterium sp. NMS12 TaxID=3079766 RepID=UPI003F88231C